MLSCLSFSLATLTYVTLVAGQAAVLQYAPSTMVQCPNVSTQPLLRVFTPQTQAIHPLEDNYIKSKESNVLPNAWTAWIGNASQLGYDSPEFGGNYSKIGMAISGGGYRAAQYGAGVISALDARNDSARAAGTGGLFQVVSYLSGASGGQFVNNR
jgi:lysophospholipase